MALILSGRTLRQRGRLLVESLPGDLGLDVLRDGHARVPRQGVPLVPGGVHLGEDGLQGLVHRVLPVLALAGAHSEGQRPGLELSPGAGVQHAPGLRPLDADAPVARGAGDVVTGL